MQNELKVRCPKCLDETAVLISEIEKNNQIACSHCQAIIAVDSEDIRARSRAIIETVFGRIPDNPQSN